MIGLFHTLTMNAVEFATVGRTKSGKVYHHLWGAEEIDALLKEHGLAQAKEEDEDRMEA